ncbi:MAG: DNA primase [Gemmatimonadales bacterium]|nr:MAG: DNA primase [Gemmatimonadales bacterium]
MIPDEVVEEVRVRADLVEVVGESVPLKRSGKDWKGKCPFHEDRTPSFYVVPAKGFYNCFGCGASGDVFDFVMKRTGLDFVEAVKQVGARFGVEVREVGREEEAEDPLRSHYEANAFAREHYRSRLAHPDEGRKGRDYLEERGIDEETAERFGLGFAPDEWRGLREAAAVHEIPDELLLEVGLITTSERSSEPYDRFRNRIIFPIESVSGKVVAFGGRVLGGAGKGVPKYLNSPESPVYHKGQQLYALGWNRHAIRKEGVALVVEGYMDVVALSAGGVDHAVATLGTALTPEQAHLLNRYTQRALLLFDSDEAGLRATFRGADVLLAAGIHPSVVTLPRGEDPDTLIRKEGAKGLRRYLDGALDVMDRKLQLLDEKGFFGSIERIRLAVDKLLPTIRATVDPTLRDIYVSRVAERTGVRRETLEEEIRSRPSSSSIGGGSPPGNGGDGHGRGGTRAPESSGSGPGRTAKTVGGSGNRTRVIPPLGAERTLLLVLLRARDWMDRALERIGPEEFRDPVWRAIFQALVENPELAAPPPDMGEEEARRLDELLASPEELDHTGQIFEDCIRSLQDREVRERRGELMARLQAEADPEERRRLARALQELSRDRPGR